MMFTTYLCYFSVFLADFDFIKNRETIKHDGLPHYPHLCFPFAI